MFSVLFCVLSRRRRWRSKPPELCDAAGTRRRREARRLLPARPAAKPLAAAAPAGSDAKATVALGARPGGQQHAVRCGAAAVASLRGMRCGMRCCRRLLALTSAPFAPTGCAEAPVRLLAPAMATKVLHCTAAP
jgi:hypothetical protein